MFRSTALFALFAFTAFSAVACSNASEDESSPGSDESNVTQADHATAVKRCDSEHEAADQNSTMAMIEAAANWGDCLARANDGAVAKLETNLAEVESHLRGQAAIAIAAAREQGETYCAEMDKASSSFGGSLSRVEAVYCRSNREKMIASFMDAYAYFGTEPVQVPEHRDQHAACYTAYDVAIENAVATNEMIQVSYDLADCIGKNADALAEPIAKSEVENDEAAGPLDAATARVKKTIADTIASGSSLCAVFNEAGDSGGGSLARVTTAGCQARWTDFLADDLKNQAGTGEDL